MNNNQHHIKTLVLALKNKLFKPLIEAGKLYFALPPLYRVLRGNKDPIYLKDDAALDAFYLNELKTQFKFTNSKTNKDIKEETKLDIIKKMREFKSNLESIAEKYSCEPHLFELALLEKLNLDSDDINDVWSFDSKKIKIELDGDYISINGFYQLKDNTNIIEEHFLSLNHINFDELISDLSYLEPYYVNINKSLSVVNIIYKNNLYFKNSIYDTINSILETVSNVQITYLKGLGEADVHELRPVMSPDSRTLIQITSTELDDEYLNKFMGKKSDSRKELVDNGFKNIFKLKNIDL